MVKLGGIKGVARVATTMSQGLHLALSRQHAGEYSGKVRSWAAELLQNVGGDIAEERLCDIEAVVRFLDAFSLSDSPLDNIGVERFGNTVYPMIFMIRAMLLSKTLRSTRMLRSAVISGLHLVLPESVASFFADMLSKKDVPLPSPSALSRFNLTLDTGYMLIIQEDREHELEHAFDILADTGVSRFGMVDSSEQCGLDYMLSCFYEIQNNVVDEVWAAIDTLARLRRDCDSADDELSDQEILELENLIGNSLQLHIEAPVAIGSGKTFSKLLHKTQAYLHQKRLECKSWERVRALLATFISLTVDLGTESGFRQVKSKLKLDEFVPGFIDIDLSGEDGVLMDDDTDFFSCNKDVGRGASSENVTHGGLEENDDSLGSEGVANSLDCGLDFDEEDGDLGLLLSRTSCETCETDHPNVSQAPFTQAAAIASLTSTLQFSKTLYGNLSDTRRITKHLLAVLSLKRRQAYESTYSFLRVAHLRHAAAGRLGKEAPGIREHLFFSPRCPSPACCRGATWERFANSQP
jgi:hypothetical protein